jgi:hypothetical protein
MKLNGFKSRSSLRGTTALAITSILLGIMTGCGHDRIDTDEFSNPPPTEVSTSCTTTPVTTSITTNLTTSTTTISTTTTTLAEETTLTTQQATENQMTTTPTETVPAESDSVVEVNSTYPITEYERILLCNIVANESGSDWISIYDKACVVACVMNRIDDSRFPNSIEEVLTQPYQFSGYYASDCYYSTVTDACIQAVDYYFEHSNEFGDYLYFEGNGTNNVFH